MSYLVVDVRETKVNEVRCAIVLSDGNLTSVVEPVQAQKEKLRYSHRLYGRTQSCLCSVTIVQSVRNNTDNNGNVSRHSESPA